MNMIKTLLCFLIVGVTFEKVYSQCSFTAKDIDGGVSFIQAPGYPAVRNSRSCSWKFWFPTRPRMLVLKVTNMQLYYTREKEYWSERNGKWESSIVTRNVCSATLGVGPYSSTGKCYDTTPFCQVYYNDDQCEVTKQRRSNLNGCANQGTSWPQIPVTFSSNGNTAWRQTLQSWSYPRGFKLEYEYIDCPPDTTASRTTTTTATTTTTTTTKFTITATSAATTTEATTHPLTVANPQTSNVSGTVLPTTDSQTTNASVFLEETNDDSTKVVAPIVATISFLLLILIVVVAVLLHIKRKRAKESTLENVYQEVNERPRPEAEMVYSSAYNTVGNYHPTPTNQNEPHYANTQIRQSPIRGEIIDQSQPNDYSAINFGFDQSNDLNVSGIQSGYEEYSTIQPVSQSNAQNQSENEVYSTVSTAAERKTTVRYNTRNSEKPIHNMVENILYESS